MNMRLTLAFVALIAISTNANAWFFFFIPGSVSSKVADVITGDEGEHCVAESAAVGDSVNLSSGGSATIKSLSGKTARCTTPEYPIRAKLGPSQSDLRATRDETATTQSDNTGTSVKLNSVSVETGWDIQPIDDRAVRSGVVMKAYNRTIDSWIQLGVAKRSAIRDLPEFVQARKAIQASVMKNSEISETKTLRVGEIPAWQFEITGLSNGQKMSYMQTIFEGSDEVVGVEIWTTSANYFSVKQRLVETTESLSGLTSRQNTEIQQETIESQTLSNQEPQPKENPIHVAPPAIDTKSIADRLKLLNELKKAGLISDHDFETKKSEILKSL
ncbi:MAG: hypothetical protein ABIF28_09025 [Pseudomonadota bacterium]